MINLPQCAFCRHFNAEDMSKETCAAFPDGIPADILKNRFDHAYPYPGDAGIHLDGDDEEATARQTRMFAGRPL